MMWTKSLSSYVCMHKSSHDLWITWVYKGLYHYLVSVSELFMHWRHNIKSKVWLLGFSGLFINSSRCNATRASGTSFWEYDTWPRVLDGFCQVNVPVSPLLKGALWLLTLSIFEQTLCQWEQHARQKSFTQLVEHFTELAGTTVCAVTQVADIGLATSLWEHNFLYLEHRKIFSLTYSKIN